METPLDITITPDIVRENIQAPYKFTDAEKIALGERVVQLRKELEQIEAEKKSAMAEYKLRAGKVDLEMDALCQKIEDGFEMRPTLARILFNTPTNGRKTFVRDDDGTVIREEGMSQSDLVRPLFRDEDGKDATAPKDDAPFLNDIDGEGTREDAENVGDPNAGATPLAEALDQAAVGTTAPKLAIADLDSKEWEPGGLMKAFKKAAKTAKWTPAQISAAETQILNFDADVEAIRTFLRPHVL